MTELMRFETFRDGHDEVVNVVEVDRDLETMLICAERYACGRQTYMPGIVCEYITGLLPELSAGALKVMEKDISTAGDYGDEHIDKPTWMTLLEKIRAEIERRPGRYV